MPDTSFTNPSNTDASKIQTISLAVLAVIAVTYSTYWLRPVLLPLVVAFFVVSGIRPILASLEKSLGIHRLVAAGLTFAAAAVIMICLGLALWLSVLELADNASAYSKRITELSEFVGRWTTSWRPPIAAEADLPTENGGSTDPAAPGENNTVIEMVDGLVGLGIATVTQSLLSLSSTSVIVLIYVYFLLIGAPSNLGEDETIQQIDFQIRSYLGLKTIISVFTGLAFGVALRIFGVPMAFTFGVLAFLLNYIPNVGPLVASMLPIPLILLDPEGSPSWMIAVISVTSMIQVISGNVIEPKMMGNAADLHPVTILIALMFWGMMWGIVGMFLATPITAGLKIVLDKYEGTRHIGNWMAGRFTIKNGEMSMEP